nr:hypothetical protein [Membranihabitans maritimus]
MMRKYYIILCFLLCGNICFSQDLYVGVSKKNITPSPLLPVSGGVGVPKPVEEKSGDLYVRAMVIEKGQNKFAIVGIDNLGWPALLGDQARDIIRSIPGENVLIGATHTHSAPDAYGFPDENGNVSADTEYLKQCVLKIAEAVEEAFANRERANLKIGVGEARGQIAYNYYAPQLYDPRCGVIQAISPDNHVIGTLVNYAIHPEVIGPDRGVLSPDLCGPLYDRIEEKAGGIAIFMNGAQGGMVTADNRRPDGEEENDWKECRRIGELLADEALRIVNEVPAQESPDVKILTKRITFPVETPLMKQLMDFSDFGEKKDGKYFVNTQMNYIHLGDAAILTIPGEALPNIGYYLKRKMGVENAFLFGLTNDAFGYILTKVDFNSFKRYEYITRTSLGEMTGEILIGESLKLFEEMDGKSLKPEVGRQK